MARLASVKKRPDEPAVVSQTQRVQFTRTRQAGFVLGTRPIK